MFPFVTASPMCCESRIGMSKSVLLGRELGEDRVVPVGVRHRVDLDGDVRTLLRVLRVREVLERLRRRPLEPQEAELDRLGRELRAPRRAPSRPRRSPRSHRLRRRLRTRRPPPPSPPPSRRQPPSDAIRSSLAASLSSSRRWKPFTTCRKKHYAFAASECQFLFRSISLATTITQTDLLIGGTWRPAARRRADRRARPGHGRADRRASPTRRPMRRAPRWTPPRRRRRGGRRRPRASERSCCDGASS